MKKILIPVFVFFLCLFLMQYRQIFAQEVCYYEVPQGVTCAPNNCDKKNIDNWTKGGFGVYRTNSDCLNKINRINTLSTDTPTPIPDPSIPTVAPGSAGSSVNSAYTLSPKLEDINDHVFTVDITFNNLQGSGPYYVCLESDLCIDSDSIRDGIAEGDESAIDKSTRMTLSDVDEGTLMRYKLVDKKITVCGDGTSRLKPTGEEGSHVYYEGRKQDWWKKMKDDNKAGCKDSRDYFHPGKVYLAAVYSPATLGENQEGWTLQSVAGFYVNHKIPEIVVNPQSSIKPGARFEITIKNDSVIPRNGDEKNVNFQHLNNFQVVVEGPGLNVRKCGYFTKNELSHTFTLPRGEGKSTLLPGNVKIWIKEQSNESNEYTSVYGRALAFTDEIADIRLRFSTMPAYYSMPDLYNVFCQGGFVYRVYDCTVSDDMTINNCKRFKDVTDPKGEKFNYYLDDPNRADIKGLLAYFDTLGVNSADTTLPCNIGSSTTNDPTKCKSVTTALGEFPVDPIGFISKVFSVVLSLAGIGALITIFYAGWRFLISRGDKEMIQKARERLTAAVVGLLFIVFALTLLSIIGGDILKIPGFG